MEAGVKYLYVPSIMKIQVIMYVRKRKRSEVYQVCINDRTKGLGQTFEEKRGGRPADVFNIIQKRPNTVVHLKVDEAMEGHRSHMEVRSRQTVNLPYYLSGLVLTRKLLKLCRSAQDKT